MYKITIAIALILVGLVAAADTKEIKIDYSYVVKVICVDGMKFAVAYSDSSDATIQMVQILGKNGKPMECLTYYRDR